MEGSSHIDALTYYYYYYGSFVRSFVRLLLFVVNRPCKSVFQRISVDPTCSVEAFNKEKLQAF